MKISDFGPDYMIYDDVVKAVLASIERRKERIETESKYIGTYNPHEYDSEFDGYYHTHPAYMNARREAKSLHQCMKTLENVSGHKDVSPLDIFVCRERAMRVSFLMAECALRLTTWLMSRNAISGAVNPAEWKLRELMNDSEKDEPKSQQVDANEDFCIEPNGGEHA